MIYAQSQGPSQPPHPRYQALLRNEIVAELADWALDTFEDAVDVAVVCDVCDVTYVSSLADWEKASVGSASTADTWDQDPALITAWERAEKRAAVAAKRCRDCIRGESFW